jgi:hypothetical protein
MKVTKALHSKAALERETSEPRIAIHYPFWQTRNKCAACRKPELAIGRLISEATAPMPNTTVAVRMA